MANSVAYILSKNLYPDAFQAKYIGVDQGTQIVYATTSTLTTENFLYLDSRLTQLVFGNGDKWQGIQLLTNPAVEYAVMIDSSGNIVLNNGTTTTTTTVAPTTTTTTAAYTAWTAFFGFNDPSESCDEVNGSITLYTSVNTISSGVSIWVNSELTVPAKTAYNSYNYYKFSGQSVVYQAVNVSGHTEVINPTNCSTTTTTVAP